MIQQCIKVLKLKIKEGLEMQTVVDMTGVGGKYADDLLWTVPSM
jgi:hypothetical protein